MTIESIQQAQQASNTSSSALSSLSKDLDNFLVILTTQLQNQDPLSPMDSNEFTNQLVQFANVEQSIAQTQKLEEMINLQKSTELTNAVSYMGKNVKVDHNEFSYKSGDIQELEYTLPEEAKTATMFVMNSDGNIVYSTPVETGKGSHSVQWDAKDVAGNPMPTGEYFFEVKAVNAEAGEIEDISYAHSGTVNAVEYGEGSATLKVGNVSVDLGKVIAVSTPASTAPAAQSPDTSNNADSEESAADQASDEGDSSNEESASNSDSETSANPTAS